MRKILILLSLTFLCGCGNKQRDERIGKLESEVVNLTSAIENLQNPERKNPPCSSESSRGDVDGLQNNLPGTVQVLSVTGRVTEANSTWWRWAQIITIANTNSKPVFFDLHVQLLDKDGFVIDKSEEDDLMMSPKMTNKFTGFTLVDSPVARNVKSFKAEAMNER